jgi:hypothetical protein
MMQVRPMSLLASSRETIFPAIDTHLPNCLIGDNFDTLPDPVLMASRGNVYSTRLVKHNAVELVRYPSGARLFGGRYFLLECDGVLAAEQFPPPNVLPDRESVATLAAETSERVSIDEPCLLVSRFGLMVWGHWMGELLPRIVLTERAFPGRFKYVLPPQVFNSSAPRNIWNSIWDTIRMLGIDVKRILPASQERQYVFSNLYGVTSTITDSAFHPGALEAIRAAYIPTPAVLPNRKVAILRTESKARNISNLTDVIRPLRQRNYEFVEIGTIPFQDQVNLFASASTIVGVLASGLTGLFFSPDHVRVASLAPQGYVNKFFYPIMQSRQASYYDVRGQITDRDPRGDLFSDFKIDTNHFIRALNCLEQGT